MRISVKDFICKSEVDRPMKATYDDYTIVSIGDQKSRCVYILRGEELMTSLWISIHREVECFIRARGKWEHDINELMDTTCKWHDCYLWYCHTWEGMEALMGKIVAKLRLESRKG